MSVAALVPERLLKMEIPVYTEKENKLAEILKCIKTPEGWWVTSTGQCVVTLPIMKKLMKQIHGSTHMGAEALVETVKRFAVGVSMLIIAKGITQKCEICLRNNPRIQKKPPQGK